DVIGPFAVNLARGVLALPEPLMAKFVPQTDDFGALDYFLRQMRRNENDTFLFAEHDVAWHDGSPANPNGCIDPHEHDIGNGRRVPAAIEHGKVGDFFHALNVACAAVDHDAIAAGFGPN